jgi:2-succinyl-5-enolpyruvyl-6-hydroxy-3-cyclohexene-1-carboxylate synthase
MTVEPTFAFCAALVDALAAQGVNHACVSPGSRNTPLLIMLAAHPAIDVSVHHDERSAAFFALGLAKATGGVPLLSCTSGTAATEYLPAITEARMAHAGMIVVTADRPPELQDRGSPQTINQTNLYGVAAKWFHDIGVPDVESVDNASGLARKAVATALEAPAGPIHLNLPLREPLVPARLLDPQFSTITATTPAAAPRIAAADTEIARIADIVTARPTVIVAGQSNSPGLGAAVSAAAAALGGIIIADPQSEIRFAGSSDPAVISTADLLIGGGFTGAVAPTAVLHVGAIVTSKPVNQWLESLGTDLVHIDDGQWHDPLRIATSVVVADPAPTLTQLAKIVEPGPPEFAAAWRRADDRAIADLADALSAPGDALTGISEPAIAATVIDTVPAGAVIVAGSSMPIRLIDSYGTRRDRPVRVIANRGANGIDGTIATALGVATAALGPTYALIGDLTALVDIGSLATASRLRTPLTVVTINNDGGGIFEYLPHSDPERIDFDTYRKLIATPHGLSLAPIAAALGVESLAVSDLESLGSLLTVAPTHPRLIEFRTDRATGPHRHREIIERIAGALAAR